MHNKIKSEFQIVLVIVFAAIILMILSIIVGGNAAYNRAAAQGPIASAVSFTPAPLEDFGLSPDEMISISANETYDLEIMKSTDVISVTPGTIVTYTVAITNKGPNDARFIYFKDSYPPEMINVSYTFPSNVEAVDNGASPENLQWLLPGVLTDGHTILITVTGELTSNRAVQVTNTAIVTTYVITADTDSSNNSNTVDVDIAGEGLSSGLIFLPIISRFPTPTPVPIALAYHEDFDSGDPWYEFDRDGCNARNTNDQYWVDLDSNKTCLPPAKNESNPEKPYRTYGEFEVEAYDSGDDEDGDTAYGIYINGEGGDNYYLFRIYPNIGGCSNGGKWHLKRRRDGDENTLLSENCNTAIKRGYGGATATNILRIAHNSSRKLTVYVNGTELGTYNESSGSHLTGEGTGLYIRSDNRDVRIKFDDFKVYKYP